MLDKVDTARVEVGGRSEIPNLFDQALSAGRVIRAQIIAAATVAPDMAIVRRGESLEGSRATSRFRIHQSLHELLLEVEVGNTGAADAAEAKARELGEIDEELIRIIRTAADVDCDVGVTMERDHYGDHS